MGKTKISWTGFVWNATCGCPLPIASEGCQFCWARKLHNMRHKAYLAGKHLPKQYAKPFEEIQFLPERLDQPLHWRKPCRIFVCSTGDLFHENVKDKWIDRIFAVMALCPQHQFQILTKRPERMAEYFNNIENSKTLKVMKEARMIAKGKGSKLMNDAAVICWPLPNVMLGVSVENDKHTERIKTLLKIPAAKKFISFEPLISSVDLLECLKKGEHSYDKKSRDNVNGIGCDRNVQGGQQGQNMAHGTNDRRQQKFSFLSKKVSRTQKGGTEQIKISNNNVHDEQKAIQSLCSPNCLDDNQPNFNTGGSGNKSQGRQQNEQSPKQSGNSNKTRKCNTQFQISESQTKKYEGRKKPNGKINQRKCFRNSEIMPEERIVSVGNCPIIRNNAKCGKHNMASSELESSKINQIIIGAESINGKAGRPCELDWVRSIVKDCKVAGVPVHIKQLHIDGKLVKDINKFPKDLQIQEQPE